MGFQTKTKVDLTKQMEQARMQVMKLYPYMQRFLDVAVKEENTEAVEGQ